MAWVYVSEIQNLVLITFCPLNQQSTLPTKHSEIMMVSLKALNLVTRQL